MEEGERYRGCLHGTGCNGEGAEVLQLSLFVEKPAIVAAID